MSRLTIVLATLCVLLTAIPDAQAAVPLANGGGWQIASAPAFVRDLHAVTFVDSDHGWVVGGGVGDSSEGSAARVYATTDGGATWVRQDPQLPPAVHTLCAVSFVDHAHGWAVGNNGGAIIATSDGGAHWVRQDSGTTKYLCAVDFVDALHGWVVGYDATILVTSDGGAHWTPQHSSLDGSPFTDVSFVDANHGWIAAGFGTFLATKDGGRHWAVQKADKGFEIEALCFVDARHGWAVGSIGHIGRGIVATTDGGAHWTSQRADTHYMPFDVVFTDRQNGWVSGELGLILHTTDGGRTWRRQQSGTRGYLWGLAFVDGSRGWVAGDRGLLSTTDGGGVDDTSAPVTRALAPVRAKRGSMASLPYRVDDPSPAGEKVRVFIKINTAAGKYATVVRLGVQKANTPLSASFRVALPKGTYRWSVYATDWALNRQREIGSNLLYVR